MRLLTVPNWSFGRDRALERICRDRLLKEKVRVHYLQGDVDHNRTVMGFSGQPNALLGALLALADLILPRIDLNHHVGVHPRIGALDVCPIVVPPGEDPSEAGIAAQMLVQELGQALAETWDLPVFMYEKSERGRHEADLPSLRRGGFGGMLDRDLKPDYGPPRCHPRLGVVVVGVRDFLIAMNVNLSTPSPRTAMALAKKARSLRQEGDPRFLGVRALGFSLPSRGLSQVSFNLTLPDITSADAIVEWVQGQKPGFHSTEVVGVVRRADLLRLTRFNLAPEAVVD